MTNHTQQNLNGLVPALEARPVYNVLYQRQGIRLPSQLVNPRIMEMRNFELPRASIYHYISQSPDEVGPPLTEPYLSGVKRLIYMYHVPELKQQTGTVIRMNVPTDVLIQQYHSRNKRYKRSLVMQAGLKDVQAPLVINYPTLLKKYKYQQTAKGYYNRWHDYYATIVKTTELVYKEAGDQHQQFILMDIPTKLPPLSMLRAVATADAPTNAQLAMFSTLEGCLLLDVFLWLGKPEVRRKSVLSTIPTTVLNTVNLVLNHQGKAVLVNLGKINGYRKSDEGGRGIDPVMMQLLWVKLNLVLKGKLSTAESSELDELIDTEEAQNPESQAPAVKVGDMVTSKDELLDPDAPSEIPTTVEEQNKDALTTVEDDIQKQDKEHTDPVITGEVDDESVDDTAPTKAIELIDTKGVDEKTQEIFARSIEKELAILERQAKLDDDRVIKPSDTPVPLYDEPVDTETIDYALPVAYRLDQMVSNGQMTLGHAARYMDQANLYKSLSAPDSDMTLEEYMRVPVEATNIAEKIDTPITESATLVDKDMAASTLNTFDTQYIQEVLPRDIAAMVVSLQSSGILVTSFDRTEEASVEGESYVYTVRVNPLDAPPTNLKFKVPKLDKEGTFVSNSTTYSLRKQKFDVPIRKVSPFRVALSSYYGKVFLERSQKRVNHYPKWLANQIRAASLDKEDKRIIETRTGDVYDNNINVPYMYSALSKEFRTITTQAGNTFYFDYHKRIAKLGEAGQRVEDATGMTLCGRTKENHLLFMDKQDNVYSFNPQLKVMGAVIPSQMVSLGYISEVLGFDSNKAPLESINMIMAGKDVPLGIVLGYDLGLGGLLKRLNVQYKKVANLNEEGNRQSLRLANDEYALRFLDYSLVFSRKDRFASLILGGFNTYRDTIKDYPIELFDAKDVYYNVLEANKLGVKYIKEIDLQYQLFIDPITLKVLLHMGMPTNYRGLLFRATEMLMENTHPDETDASQQRIRGYERIAGTVYTEMVRSIRLLKMRGGNSTYGVELNPNAVYLSIMTDPAKEIVKELNPIGRLKEREAITYSGNGGRSGDTMVRRTRAYHKKDMGVISEAGVDNANVGINMFTSANPRFTNLYGLSDPINPKEKSALKPTQLLSTTSLLNVGSMNDDSKRVGFGSIMRNHIVPTYGNSILPLRTGYEQVIAKRVGKTFAHTAAKAGKVTEVDEKTITVTYDDGSTETFPIGRSYGSSGGLTVPLDMRACVKVGDKVNPHDLVAYNPSHFAPDPLDPKVVSMKDGVIAKVALLESNFTLEDSNAVSRNFSRKLGMEVTKKVSVWVKFDNEVHHLAKVGQEVKLDDVLCIIEDPITATNSMFDEESILMLQSLGAMAPKAKKNGRIEKIEVYYHGDKDDMSESLKAIADTADRRLLKETKTATRKGYTGSVGNSFRYEAKPLEPDSALLIFYITGHEDFGGGDKCLFANQMKSTVGAVLEEAPVTQSGVEIDALFGVRSIYARIVLSPMLIGTTTSLLKALSVKVATKYLDKLKSE